MSKTEKADPLRILAVNMSREAHESLAQHAELNGLLVRIASDAESAYVAEIEIHTSPLSTSTPILERVSNLRAGCLLPSRVGMQVAALSGEPSSRVRTIALAHGINLACARWKPISTRGLVAAFRQMRCG